MNKFYKNLWKEGDKMFKYLSVREQLMREKCKNEELRALCKDLEDATIELAEIIAEHDSKIEGLEGN